MFFCLSCIAARRKVKYLIWQKPLPLGSAACSNKNFFCCLGTNNKEGNTKVLRNLGIMMKKSKFWKSIGAIILLLMFHVDAMATDIHVGGVDITYDLDGRTAVVSLSTSGDLSANAFNIVMPIPWHQMTSIQFKSVDGAAYNEDDWGVVARIINNAVGPENKTVALDFSEITIADDLFYFERVTLRKKITSIVMPNGLTTLADRAFNGCTSLNNVGWSPALTSIGEDAFFNTGFTSITIPEGVTSIGKEAFADCAHLGSITFPATLQTVGQDVIMKSPVVALYSRNPNPPTAQGDFCSSTAEAASVYNWNFEHGEFDFYYQCVLYVEPNEDILKAYSEAPYWHKFFIKGVVKIYLRPTDLQRPQVTGPQQLNVVSEHVNDGAPTTFTINTVYVRSMDPNKWYTIMLPFAVSNAMLKEVFGEDTQVWGYTGVYDNTLCFDEPVTKVGEGMEADTPYLIKPGVGKGEYEFNGADVDYTPFDASPSLSVAGGQKGPEQYTSTFQGTYTNQKIPTYAYYLKNNKFYYMPGENTTLGWKAYGGIVYVSDEGNAGQSAKVNVFDLTVEEPGVATGIESYQMETKRSDGLLYNLAGQQVRQPKRGIYVRNGKKIIIK